MRSAMATAEKPISISSETWLWRRSCMRMRLTWDLAHPRSSSWSSFAFVNVKILESGPMPSDSTHGLSPSARNSGMTTSRTDLGVLGGRDDVAAGEPLVGLGHLDLCARPVEVGGRERQ